ncbi:Hypothetical protein, putative [Bodo saltans]|uniref:Uncharacterized protein n=1 Tax=Bodo saltans TaxID=75058 RepID=A0A0S4J743_BODSA|nr:Hypothetical protein, putative [Bodo saltans]|eukprot:CUG85766.1 Hypothetical protein, putative [Bodo saltans]
MLQNRDRREAAMITGVAPQSTNPLASQRISAGYSSETQRLQTNAALTLRQKRDAERTHRDSATSNLRQIRQNREDTRQTNMTNELLKSQQEAAAIAGTGMRNVASIPYNVINHEFTSEAARKQAVYEDQLTRHSFLTRTNKLDKKVNPAGYNIINGTNRVPIDIPPKPAHH